MLPSFILYMYICIAVYVIILRIAHTYTCVHLNTLVVICHLSVYNQAHSFEVNIPLKRLADLSLFSNMSMQFLFSSIYF